MWAVPVVPAQIAGESSSAVGARGVRKAVSPLAQQCLDERLGLSVRLRPARAGVAASDPELGAGLCPGVRAVTVAVVGEHALDRDPTLPVPGRRSTQEGDAVGGTLTREQLRIGEPGVIVDRQVQVLPAGVATAGQPVTVDALADRPEATQPLDVDVQELTRTLSLVAAHRLSCG